MAAGIHLTLKHHDGYFLTLTMQAYVVLMCDMDILSIRNRSVIITRISCC